MTMAILSPPRTSTSGRAPVFSITMRFWIKVESLNRPPTLLTISSSFSSSNMGSPLEVPLEDPPQLGDGRLEFVVDQLVLVLAAVGQLPLRGRQAPPDGRLRVGVPVAQALLQHRQGRRLHEHRDGVGVQPA